MRRRLRRRPYTRTRINKLYTRKRIRQWLDDDDDDDSELWMCCGGSDEQKT